MYRLASAIPGPDEELPMMGIAHTLTGSTEDIMTTLQKYSYFAMKNDGIMRGWLGHILYFLVVDPLDLEMVLKTCLEKDDLHRFMRKIIGYGGIFAPVAIWRKRRKTLIPAFSPKIVESFVEVFSEQSEKLALQLKEVEGCGQVSVWRFLSTYTLDAVCETVMGIKINAQENPNAPFLKAMQNILNLVTERVFHLWLQPDWLYKFFPQYSKHQKYRKVMHDFTDEVIHNKREELKKERNYQTGVDDNYDLRNYKRQSFLDLLIKLSGGEKGYSDEELREEILTLSIAGTDTSAVAIGYTLKLLAKYPKVQDRVFQEIQELFGDSDRPLVKEDLIHLNYLERVVKESLRLFPPVPFIIRKVLEDIDLPSGRVLPAGSGIVVSIWGVHRDPKYWGPDAECFDPDRFLPERLNLQHACSYIPFSNGPRNCVGYQYALMSVKTALAAIVRRYKIVGDEEPGLVPFIKTKIDVMMKAVDDYEIGLEKRTLP
ncbi:unnamed protein product [Parnassius apollo]|uniref:(apollo) hypothetical protein n=1 Tax=Parnassius apollo TaxID=110799 RepID=A0A8S3XP27_PARAO|nr:unnamed protein product [Parnassius apollo]